MMSAAVASPAFLNFGSMPYDDVYLEDVSSEEDEDEHIMSNSRKPLMSPRKRPKITLRQPPATVKIHPLIKRRFLRWCYVIVAALVISLMVFILLRISHDAMDHDEDSSSELPTSNQGISASKLPPFIGTDANADKVRVLPCTDFEVEDVWIQNIPKLITETAIRMVDVNKDGILDVIMGFSTGVTGYFESHIMCDIYFNGAWPCFGGLLALDGKTGTELWRHYAANEIFAVNCNADIDRDGVKDCLGAGRAGSFQLVSGATGREIWKFNNEELLVSISNFYTAQFIEDVDGDGTQDVLNIHGGDPLRTEGEKVTHIGILIIMSGATGHVVTSMQVPDRQESYFSPQVYYQHGGRQMVLFGTGGETHGGSLWVISMRDLLRADDKKVTAIYTDPYKGVMTPPTLADITGDGVVDIVMAMFNSTTVAFDGQNYNQLWNYTMAESESYSTPAAAFFNDDDVPDFMIAYNHGPGYPVYYYSQVTVLDGRTGQPILDAPIKTSGASQSSPLTVSIEGKGHDLFMYFLFDCLGHEGESNSFEFFQEEKMGKGSKSRADFCKLRFNTKSYSTLQLLAQHMKTPGEQIYNSLDRVDVEYQYKINSSVLAQAYLDTHPSVLEEAKELALNGQHSHGGDGHDVPGGTHSSDRGDEQTDGQVHRDDGAGSDDQIPRLQTKEDSMLDFMSKQKQNEILQQLAEEMGLEDVSELPMLQTLLDSGSVDNQQDLYQPDIDQQLADSNPQNSYTRVPFEQNQDPQNSYQQQPYEQSPDLGPEASNPLKTDPRISHPRNPYADDLDTHNPDPHLSNPHLSNPHISNPHISNPHISNPHISNPHDPFAENPESDNSRPQHPYAQKPDAISDLDDEDESDSGLSRNFMKDLLNQLLNDKQTVDPQPDVDESHGYFNSKPQRYKTHESTDDQALHDKERKDSYLDELLGQLGDNTYSGKQYGSRYQDSKPGYRQGGEKYDRYGGAHAEWDPVEQQRANWLDDLYGSSRDDRSTRRQFRQKRDAQTITRITQTIQDEAFKLSGKATSQRERYARHSGPHDDGGIQRLISTGTLAPVLSGDGVAEGESIDVIFATYWFFPADTQIILPEQQECIDEWTAKEAQRLDPKNVFYGMDHDAYEHMASDKCLEKGDNKEKLRAKLSSLSPLDIYPFNRHTGEMTVYRLRLKCRCGVKPSAHKRCTKILPYSKQQWGGYMGTYGNGHFSPRT